MMSFYQNISAAPTFSDKVSQYGQEGLPTAWQTARTLVQGFLYPGFIMGINAASVDTIATNFNLPGQSFLLPTLLFSTWVWGLLRSRKVVPLLDKPLGLGSRFSQDESVGNISFAASFANVAVMVGTYYVVRSAVRMITGV